MTDAVVLPLQAAMMRPVLLLAFAVLCALLHCSAAAPRPGPGDNERHGNVDVSARRDKGVGTSVHVRGEGDAWVSRDGNSRVKAGGHYGEVVHGPAKGARDYGGHVTYERRF